jgi:hypothetical protein
VSGDLRTPALSPDGSCVLFRRAPAGGKVRREAVRTAGGAPAPFETVVHIVRPTEASLGRPRRMPDGKHILFLGRDDRGVTGVYGQNSVPGRDTTATWRAVGGFDAEVLPKSYDVSADRRRLLIAGWEQLFRLMEASPPSSPLISRRSSR